jgi:hypothetical protein
MTGAGSIESKGPGTLIRHPGPANIAALAEHVGAWLSDKGFETDYPMMNPGGAVVRAHEPRSWKTAIGASPSLEVQLIADPQGTYVDIGLAKAGGVTWAARYFTYSWVALGVSFLNLKRDLGDLISAFLQPEASTPSSDLAVIAVVETDRSERRLGSDQRHVDNSGSGSPVTRTLKVRKRWLQTCRIDIEKTSTGGVALEGKVLDLLTLSANVEQAVRRQYAISTDVEQEFEEQIQLAVPAHKSLTLSLDWKQIIQHGEVRIVWAADGKPFVVPYEVDVGVTFDQRQIEE